jgi:imidazolonepropionase-like amidohydrolase
MIGTAVVANAVSIAASQPVQMRGVVLDNVRIIDGSGAAPIESGRIVIERDRIARIGRAAEIRVPAGAETVDLSGRTVIPGLIDLHFHIENDPKLALRQLSHGITAFRDPGQWDEQFDALRRMIGADNMHGPRIFTTGPHIDGENPAYTQTPSSRATQRKRAATTTAAAFLYRSDQLGSLRAGFNADLVVLRGQPDRDVRALRTVERVMVAGQWIDTSKYREH